VSTTLLIARHGNTFGPNDVPTRVGARTDLPLVNGGLTQARLLGQYLREQALVPSVAYTSRLRRAIETADGALHDQAVMPQVRRDAFLDEIDYGPDENQTEESVVARIGQEAIEAWNLDAVVPPGWQVDPDRIVASWLTFGARCLAEHQDETILVVTSNGTARFAPHLTGDFASFSREHDIKLSTGALAILTHDDTAGWRVVDWNIKPRDEVRG
jgi:2,3-bisphosphoglycerate-dependent phosphoglycerate mutase